ncbi:prephenate dehydrogenase [Abyssisolibacter fermentans]|uniref:prephenate dehydrogenase n=1 Tax=Abyssisolibacter fermentans TaxID=1766203 RepID=UPI000829F810|nr:prephenate dehydrogenase [Abyssisolibacter fermentans]
MKSIELMNVTVVGLGLIGGSIAKALNDINPQNIWGIDISHDVLERAIEEKIIDKGYIDSRDILSKSDLVIISLYPADTINFIKKNMNNFKSGAIITDTAGIKGNLVESINDVLRDDLEYIGGHPMAGKECSGIENSSKEMFKGANYIITPTRNNKKDTIDFITDLVIKLGFENVSCIDPDKHDSIIALTSQLPHVIATAAVMINDYNNIDKFVGGSYQDITRVADINSKLWTELFISNSDKLAEQLQKFEDAINKFKTLIINKDAEAVNKLLDEGGIRKRGYSWSK